jgi:hypothetical protein
MNLLQEYRWSAVEIRNYNGWIDACCLVHTVDIEELPRDLGDEIEETDQALSPFLPPLSTPATPPFSLSAPSETLSMH